MTRICAHCGTEADGDALFCPTCGQPFEAGVQPELPPAPDWPEPPSPLPAEDDQEPAAVAVPPAFEPPATEPRAAEPPPVFPPAAEEGSDVPPEAQTTHAWERLVSEEPVPPWRRGAAHRASEPEAGGRDSSDEPAPRAGQRPAQPAAAPQPGTTPPEGAIFSVPVLLSDWLVGGGALVGLVSMFLPWALGGRYTSGWGLASGVNVLVSIVLLGALAVVFLAQLLPRIPQRSLILMSVGLVGTGIGLDRLGLPLTGVGSILFLIASLAMRGRRRHRAARPGPGGRRAAGLTTTPRPRSTATAPPVPDERHGLTADEYRAVVRLIGREPNPVELGMFGAMWSEHCAYKHSRALLGSLPTTGERVLVGPGENAGALDIGDGLAVVFKVESHNHPSAVEPYQGAATGVGGIIRDIFTMGARPIALLNGLRFGPLDPADDASGRTDPATATRNRYLLGGVVGGIAGYGNCIGIPDVGGELFFDASYSGNPLVNALCLGVARHDEITLARAGGPGNALLLVGSDTGRDGIAGASFASATLGDDRDERRPAVQVGNPFLEKLLMEACLELSRSDAVVAMQDLGAAGLTCALAEVSARGGCGADVDLDLVPRREEGMTPYEVLLSESQERMLVVVRAGREAEVQAVFAKYDLHAVTIGRVIAEPVVRARAGGEAVCAVSGAALADEAPRYVLPAAPPAGLAARRAQELEPLASAPPDPATLLELLGGANAAEPQVDMASLRPHERHEHAGGAGRR